MGVKRKYFFWNLLEGFIEPFCAQENFGGNDDNDIMISSDHAKGLWLCKLKSSLKRQHIWNNLRVVVLEGKIVRIPAYDVYVYMYIYTMLLFVCCFSQLELESQTYVVQPSHSF